MSALGIFGKGISMMFRALSSAIFTITASKKDRENHPGHRLFFHTILGAIVIRRLIVFSF